LPSIRDPRKIDSAGNAVEIARQGVIRICDSVVWREVEGIDVGQGRKHAGAIDGLLEELGVGGEVLHEVESTPVQANDADGIARGDGLHKGADIGTHEGVAGIVELIENDNGLGDGFRGRRLNGEGVWRQGRRGRDGGIVGCVVLIEVYERLGDAVLGEGEVGWLEAMDWVAVCIYDDDIELDQAGGDVDGGDGLGVWWRLGCGDGGCGGRLGWQERGRGKE
jgi:hypothetical protein